MKKRVLSLLLVIVMVLGLVPTFAMAEEANVESVVIDFKGFAKDASALVNASKPELLLVVTPFRFARVVPIIGPPSTTFTVVSALYWQSDIIALIGVPIRTSKFLGASTPLPETVITRWYNGLPCTTAWYTA